MHTLFFDGLGTQWSIFIDSDSLSPKISPEISQTISTFERDYSRFLPDSEISKINKTKSPTKISPDLETMVNLGQNLKTLTKGYFNLNIASMIAGHGYDAQYSFVPNKRLINQPRGSFFVENHILTKTGDVQLDLGALGKGYLIDLIAKYLHSQKTNHFLVDGGGDIFATTKKNDSPWHVAIEHPLDPTRAIAEISLRNQAIATSSSQKRQLNDFHHLLNPKTKKPSKKLLSVTTLSKNAFHADATATAIFISPQKYWPQIAKEFNTEYLAVFPNQATKKSKNFPDIYT